MKLTEYAACDATELAERIRRKEITPQEALDACIQGIDQLESRINAISYRAYEMARAQIAAGIPEDAPFAGVPFLLKDEGPLARGIPATAGSRLIQGMTCEEDTELVKRFKRAGFVIVGTTKTPECCFTNTTESILHGATRNPWSLERIAGGSSGGSAAAVASGIVPIAHGADGGGSIREPASCCGVVGLKPSRFRVPNGPSYGNALSGFGCNFALTRSVRDAAGLLDAIQGPDAGCFGFAPLQAPYAETIRRDPDSLRIAYMARYPLGGEIDAECKKALMDTVSLLRDLGHTVEEAYPTLPENMHWARGAVEIPYVVEQLESASEQMGRPLNRDYVEEMLLEVYRLGKSYTAMDTMRGLHVCNDISREMGRFMQNYDILLCPTIGMLPCKIGDTDQNVHPEWDYEQWKAAKGALTHFTNLFNITGQPSMSIPLCMSESGLPIGMELNGRIGDEGSVFALAAQLERARPWKERHPQNFVTDVL